MTLQTLSSCVTLDQSVFDTSYGTRRRKSDESLGLERMPSAVNMMLVWASADTGMSLDGSSDPIQSHDRVSTPTLALLEGSEVRRTIHCKT